MRYMSIPEAALLWRLSPEQLRKNCETHQLVGAVRFGYRWLIPADARRPILADDAPMQSAARGLRPIIPAPVG